MNINNNISSQDKDYKSAQILNKMRVILGHEKSTDSLDKLIKNNDEQNCSKCTKKYSFLHKFKYIKTNQRNMFYLDSNDNKYNNLLQSSGTTFGETTNSIDLNNTLTVINQVDNNINLLLSNTVDNNEFIIPNNNSTQIEDKEDKKIYSDKFQDLIYHLINNSNSTNNTIIKDYIIENINKTIPIEISNSINKIIDDNVKKINNVEIFYEVKEFGTYDGKYKFNSFNKQWKNTENNNMHFTRYINNKETPIGIHHKPKYGYINDRINRWFFWNGDEKYAVYWSSNKPRDPIILLEVLKEYGIQLIYQKILVIEIKNIIESCQKNNRRN